MKKLAQVIVIDMAWRMKKKIHLIEMRLRLHPYLNGKA
jgi:hypothetical protein